jgi:hypothetical protein
VVFGAFGFAFSLYWISTLSLIIASISFYWWTEPDWELCNWLLNCCGTPTPSVFSSVALLLLLIYNVLFYKISWLLWPSPLVEPPLPGDLIMFDHWPLRLWWISGVFCIGSMLALELCLGCIVASALDMFPMIMSVPFDLSASLFPTISLLDKWSKV